MKGGALTRLELKGLEPAPSQVLGPVRLVPLLRKAPRGDLRIARQHYGDGPGVVDLGNVTYSSTYMPHGFVIGYTDDGSPVASYGAKLAGPSEAKKRGGSGVTLLHRMRKRLEDDESGAHRLRIVPQRLAFEGLLMLCFGGPDIAWSDYSKRAISQGLSPRSETVISGNDMPYLEDALRLFEIHDEQSGVLLFIGDQMAEAFVVSHPDDYRALHETVITDLLDSTLLWAALYAGKSPELPASLDGAGVATVAELRERVARFRADVGRLHIDTGRGLIGRELHGARVYRAGPFSLERFMTQLDLSSDNHIGEVIVRDDGTLEYAKTYRMSTAQQKRAYLLSMLSRHNWNLDATAAALGTVRPSLIVRLYRAGFGYLIAEHELMAALKLEARR